MSENKKMSGDGDPGGGDWNFGRGRGRGRGELGARRGGTDPPGSPTRATLDGTPATALSFLSSTFFIDMDLPFSCGQQTTSTFDREHS